MLASIVCAAFAQPPKEASYIVSGKSPPQQIALARGPLLWRLWHAIAIAAAMDALQQPFARLRPGRRLDEGPRVDAALPQLLLDPQATIATGQTRADEGFGKAAIALQSALLKIGQYLVDSGRGITLVSQFLHQLARAVLATGQIPETGVSDRLPEFVRLGQKSPSGSAATAAGPAGRTAVVPKAFSRILPSSSLARSGRSFR